MSIAILHRNRDWPHNEGVDEKVTQELAEVEAIALRIVRRNAANETDEEEIRDGCRTCGRLASARPRLSASFTASSSLARSAAGPSRRQARAGRTRKPPTPDRPHARQCRPVSRTAMFHATLTGATPMPPTAGTGCTRPAGTWRTMRHRERCNARGRTAGDGRRGGGTASCGGLLSERVPATPRPGLGLPPDARLQMPEDLRVVAAAHPRQPRRKQVPSHAASPVPVAAIWAGPLVGGRPVGSSAAFTGPVSLYGDGARPVKKEDRMARTTPHPRRSGATR